MSVERAGRNLPWHMLRAIGLIAVAAIVVNLITLANPGFFNHDEWQRLDHIHAHGFWSYVQQYGAVHAGPNFGFPVRPIGFIQQGFSSLFMQDFPFMAHLLDVLIHAGCALALWWCLQSSPLRGRHALVAALVFAVSPLATFSTAWVGASFDRLYVLFALVSATGALRIAAQGLRPWPLVLLAIGAIGAILSKETAIMLPSALVLALAALKVRAPASLRFRDAMAILVVVSIPIAIYLAIRLPALQASFGGQAGAYDPAKGSLLGNAYLYFAQPFLVPAVELVSAPLLPKWTWAVAALLHAVMVLALVCRRGLWTGFFYLAGYFVFLLPVMPVSIIGAHYLYGSGVAFAIGMALLLPPEPLQRRWLDAGVCLVFVGALVVALWHTVYIQRAMYTAGKCEMLFLNSLDAQLPAAAAAGEKIVVLPDPGALGYVALRSTFGRSPYAAGSGTEVVVREGGQDTDAAGERQLHMDTQCRLVAR